MLLSPSTRRLVLAALVPAAALVSGCNYIGELKLPFITESGKQVEPAVDSLGPTPVYPETLPLGQPLDVQVTRVGNAVVLDNRTIQTFENAQLWLNHQYGAPIGRMGIGPGQPLSLDNFRNIHGESYPVGGLLSPDLDAPVVAADLVADGRIHKLFVRLEPNWQTK
jgi:hypothetical protein